MLHALILSGGNCRLSLPVTTHVGSRLIALHSCDKWAYRTWQR